MCGIAGHIDQRASSDLLDRQLSTILHRGPDGEGRHEEGALHLGMRRLSIIDLQHGWQPLTSRKGRVLAFQNGEIYNYKKLRSELEILGYIFQTTSDTEVLAHGYDAWGIEGILNRIDGMYAIAIADLDNNLLHLARDRFGEKPLYYSYCPGKFAYGSSLKAVAIVPWVGSDINPWAIERYFACHYVNGRQTILKDAFKLLPGERLEIDINAFSPPRTSIYYKPSLQRPRPATLEEIENLLDNAVKSRLVADVPVGIFLSGGIDSSLIGAFAARHQPDIEAFCISFDDPNADESQYAQAVADHLGIKLNKFHFDGGRFQELIPIVCSMLDEPVGDQAMLPVYLLAKAASAKVKVVLSGEGADEIFSGYSYYNSSSEKSTHEDEFSYAYKQAFDAAGRAVGSLVEVRGETQSGFPLLTYHEERRKITGQRSSPDPFEFELMTWLSTAHSPLQRKGAADLATWLPDDLLIKADRMTMASSIEGRCPFLSPDVVERALALPEPQKYSNGESKVILRALARRLLPSEIVDRRKHGFVLPMTQWVHEWFIDHGGLKEYISSVKGLGLDVEALESLYSKTENYGRERLYFAIIVLVEWWKSFTADVEASKNVSGIGRPSQ
ncbi:asparagine synthase (glutamine-hydrolyzing) [Methylobacterium brachiatum]|uniref:asparagine synthase (glutamine-hydrolyzing) n=1 Tax=Methylobacterium brachiatum TaxID=269660 RepID=A0ABV1R8J0_9HYPH